VTPVMGSAAAATDSEMRPGALAIVLASSPEQRHMSRSRSASAWTESLHSERCSYLTLMPQGMPLHFLTSAPTGMLMPPQGDSTLQKFMSAPAPRTAAAASAISNNAAQGGRVANVCIAAGLAGVLRS
jgi:hypothetical protein